MTRRVCGLILLSASVAAAGVVTFAPRRMRGYDERSTRGRCIIRVMIDDEADVELRQDRIAVRAITGRDGRDDGSECTQPLPAAELIDFRFRGIDGRGEVRLVQEPRRSNRYTAVVNIRDRKGGDEGYTFELSWESREGSVSGSSGRDRDRSDIVLEGDGRGSYDWDGRQVRLVRGWVNVRDGREARLEFRDASGRTIAFDGIVRETRGLVMEVDITNSTRGRARGTARISYGTRNLRAVSLSGELDRRRFELSFER